MQQTSGQRKSMSKLNGEQQTDEENSRLVPRPPPSSSGPAGGGVAKSAVRRPTRASVRSNSKASVSLGSGGGGGQSGKQRQSYVQAPRSSRSVASTQNGNSHEASGNSNNNGTAAETAEDLLEAKQKTWKDSLRVDVFGSVWAEIRLSEPVLNGNDSTDVQSSTPMGKKGLNDDENNDEEKDMTHVWTNLQSVNFSICKEVSEKTIQDSCIQSTGTLDTLISSTGSGDDTSEAVKAEIEGTLSDFHRRTVLRVVEKLNGRSSKQNSLTGTKTTNSSLFGSLVHAEASRHLNSELKRGSNDPHANKNKNSNNGSSSHGRRRSSNLSQSVPVDWNHMYQSSLEAFLESLATEYRTRKLNVENKSKNSIALNHDDGDGDDVESQRQSLLTVIAAFVDRAETRAGEVVEMMLLGSSSEAIGDDLKTFIPLKVKHGDGENRANRKVEQGCEGEGGQATYFYRDGLVFYVATPPFHRNPASNLDSAPMKGTSNKTKPKPSPAENPTERNILQQKMERSATRFFRDNQSIRNSIIEYNASLFGRQIRKNERREDSLSEYLFLTGPLVACFRVHGYVVLVSTIIPTIPESCVVNASAFMMKQSGLLERALTIRAQRPATESSGAILPSQLGHDDEDDDNGAKCLKRITVGQDSRLYVTGIDECLSQFLPLPYAHHPLNMRMELLDVVRMLPLHNTSGGRLNPHSVKLEALSSVHTYSIKRCADVISMISAFTEIQDGIVDSEEGGEYEHTGGEQIDSPALSSMVCLWCGAPISVSELTFIFCHCPEDCCRLCANCYGTLLIRDTAAPQPPAGQATPSGGDPAILSYLQQMVDMKCKSGARKLDALRMFPDVGTILHLYGVNLSMLGHVYLHLHPASRFVTAKYLEVEMISRIAARHFFALLRQELESAARSTSVMDRKPNNEEENQKSPLSGKLMGRTANWSGATLIRDVCLHTCQVFLSKFLGGGSATVNSQPSEAGATESSETVSTTSGGCGNLRRGTVGNASKGSRNPPALDSTLMYWATELGPSVEASYFSACSSDDNINDNNDDGERALESLRGISPNASLLMNPLSTEKLSIELLWQRFAELVGITMTEASKMSFVDSTFPNRDDTNHASPFLSVSSISSVAKTTTLPQILMEEGSSLLEMKDSNEGQDNAAEMKDEPESQAIQQSCGNYGEYLLFWIAFQSSNPDILEEHTKSVYLHD